MLELLEMIDVMGLGRKFQNKVVFKDVALRVEKGEFATLKGKNGSGKTTLLRILATLTLPTWGNAKIGGYCTKTEATAVRKILGWAPCSDIGFIPRFNGLENLFFFGRLYGIKHNLIESFLARWENWETLRLALETPFHASSSGMRQSLLIARALLNNPEVVLLDEPNRGLDQNSSQQLMTFLKKESAGKAIIVTSHSDDFDKISSKSFLLNEGFLE